MKSIYLGVLTLDTLFVGFTVGPELLQWKSIIYYKLGEFFSICWSSTLIILKSPRVMIAPLGSIALYLVEDSYIFSRSYIFSSSVLFSLT